MRDQIQSSMLIQLYDYWLSLCDAGRLPPFSSVDPAAITRCLPGMLVLDVVGEPRRFRYRLAGTEVESVTGQYRQDKYLDEIDLGELSKPTIDMMHGVVDNKAPSYVLGQFQDRRGDFYRYERVAMPMLSDGSYDGSFDDATVDVILVGIEYVPVVETAHEAIERISGVPPVSGSPTKT